MRRLAHQIHLTVLLVLVLFAALAGAAWHLLGDGQESRFVLGALALAADRVAPAGAAPERVAATVDDLADLLGAPVGLWSTDGRLLHRTSAEVDLPPADDAAGERRVRFRGPQMTVSRRLVDGRWLAVHYAGRRGHRAYGLGVLALLALAIGVGAMPLTRRLTRRLERLRSGVEDLGGGDLAARVEVEGRDEVAQLARSFNAAAERIEALVEAQRTALIGASHELRTPLARLRVALELIAGGGRPDLHSQVEADIAELDALIDEILLASRLEALRQLEARQDRVDLLALAAEEAARVEATVEGEPVVVCGNERLLRRLVRNLLDNAVRHGDPASVRIAVERAGDRACLRVTDAGPGIPAAERERVFEPFYRPAGAAESGRGYGLGLALVRRIAQLHGGEAHCLEGPRGGGRFDVAIPVSRVTM